MKATVFLDRLFNVVRTDGAIQQLFGCTLYTILGNNIHLLFNLKKAQFPLNAMLLQTTWPYSFVVQFEIEQQWQDVQCCVEYLSDKPLESCCFVLHLHSTSPLELPSLADHILSSLNSISFSASDPMLLPLIRKIVDCMPCRAHFKEAETLTYQYANEATLKLLGMGKLSDLADLNDYEVAKYMSWRWPGDLADSIQSWDKQVIQSNQPMIDFEESPYLDAEGNIVFHKLTKIPLYSTDHQPLGILTMGIDQAKYKDVHWLRLMYTTLYPDKRMGFHLFLENLGVLKLLKNKNPGAPLSLSERQFDTWFLISQGQTVKECAKTLGISNRTVEMYVDQLREKFHCVSKSELADLYHSMNHQNSMSS